MLKVTRIIHFKWQVMTHDNLEIAELLLKKGANPNIQDQGRHTATSNLRTIAHDVAASGYTDMLRCLLLYGADVSLQVHIYLYISILISKGGTLR